MRISINSSMNTPVFQKSVFLLLVLALATVVSWSQPASKKTVQVVLLAGQSNMAGAGNYDELDEQNKERITKVSGRVLMSMSGKPAEPLSYFDNEPGEKYDFTRRFGPELLSGLTLAAKNPDQEYLLIKTAMGGTSLYGAWNPNWSEEKSKEVEAGIAKQQMKLYQLHLDNVKKALLQLQEQGKAYKIIGMMWMQGENDAAKEISADSYKENLEKLIAGYRKEFQVEKMPFIIGQINSRYGKYKDGPAVVRAAMQKVADADKYVGIVNTSTDSSWSDYPKHTDNVHYNTEGQRRLGIAFANGLLALMK